MTVRHIPVLLTEVVEALQVREGMNVIDCTLGDAGHAEAILKKNGPNGKVLGIDVDPEAILRAKHFLHEYGDRVIVVRDNFARLQQIVQKTDIQPIGGILMDLGWSTPQFEERGRGFSFLHQEEPLDMRLSGSGDRSAAELIADASQEALEKIFRLYGEEGLAKEIAQAISEYTREKSIERVKDLVDIVLSVYRKKLKTDKEVPWIGGLHPATKVFQALRIAVNNELNVLETALPQALEVLAPGGRLAVISFHSLEDRVVKHFFKSQKHIRILTKKPITCATEEYDHNPRSRSAKLRVVEKI